MSGNPTGAAITGVSLLVAGLVGGGVTLAGAEFPVLGNPALQAVVILTGAALLKFNTQWPASAIGLLALASLGVVGWGAVADDGGFTLPDPRPSIQSPAPTQEPDIVVDDPAPEPEPDPEPEPEPGCTVVVSNPLATLREQPENFAQEMVRVPSGTYAVRDVTEVPWAGQTERWLAIEVEGRNGWLKHNTFNIESRSSDCSF